MILQAVFPHRQYLHQLGYPDRYHRRKEHIKHQQLHNRQPHFPNILCIAEKLLLYIRKESVYNKRVFNS